MEKRPAWQNNAFIIELSNGQQWNSWQNDVIIEAKRIPVFANIEENQEKMLGVDGLYDFGTEFENAVIELDVVVRADSIDKRIAKVAEIARLLNPKTGFQKMIFGDRPSIYYMVKVNNTMQQDLTKHKDLSYFTISLNAHPYAYKTGTSATFSGNGADGIEMLIDTKTDADVPFRMEIGGNLEIKAPDFWDEKDDSKNIIPNPRFQKDANGDAVKWNVSQEYNSEEDFYKEFGYVKEYPIYSDTQEDFINKIKNGTYTAEDFKIKITYSADEKGYLVRTYHYLINNYEIYTTTDTQSYKNWLGCVEYRQMRLISDIKYIFNTLLANKIAISSYLDISAQYLGCNWIQDYNMGNKDNNWFLNNTVEKTFKIIENKLDFKDMYCAVKEGKIAIKELGVKEYFTQDRKYEIFDVLINGVLVDRYRETYSDTDDFPDSHQLNTKVLSNSWDLKDFGLSSFNTQFVSENYARTIRLNIEMPTNAVYSQFWKVENNVIKKKNPITDDIGTINTDSIKLLIHQTHGNYSYSFYNAIVYVNGVIAKTVELENKSGGTFYSARINALLTAIKEVTDAKGIINTLTDTDLNNAFENIRERYYSDDELVDYWYSLNISNNTIQAPVSTDIIPQDVTNTWYDISPKLPYIADHIGKLADGGDSNVVNDTITVSFTEQKLMQIPHNALTFTLSPYYSEFESRCRYVYSDVIGLDTLDKDYVLSAYLRDDKGKFGLIILDNNEVFKRVVLRTPQDYEDWTREYFTEHLGAEDKKVIVFFEVENTTHETDTLTMEFALPQLEIFPLSDFSENGTLYSLETRARKNLVDNSGFKFGTDGRMDRWGWTDNSAGMITKQYTAADLPKDLNGKSLGYGVVEITCADNSTNNYSAYLSQSIKKIKPNTTYTLSAYLKENGDTTTLKAKLTIVQKNANSAIIDAKTKELTLTTAWALYSHTITTKAETTSIEMRIETEKKEFALTSPAVIKIGAIQFEENSMATAWEDDNWEAEYLVVTKNMVYNPSFGAIAGESLPDGWERIVESPTGTANTTISLTKATVVGGIERPAVRFNFSDEIDDTIAIWLKSKPFAVNENRYYAISLYCRAKNIVNDFDMIAHTIQIRTSFIDTNGVVISEFIEEPNLIQSTDTWGRYHIKGSGNDQAPAGAVSCVISVGVTKLDYVGDGAYAEFACIQAEEVSNWDSNMTAWEDNYTFTVKPPEEHSTIKPVYIKNPRIYKADGTLFFRLDATIKNTEKIIIDTEKYQAYIIKEDGTKINVLDDVFIYIYNRLDKQILSTDKMYLRYVDNSGLDENTQEPVAVTIKIDWTARTF
jgi:hypothetical protein